jgi:DNA adenine methylase
MQYVGGKFRIRKQLVDFLLEYVQDANYFVEPFCGSCNVVLELLENVLFLPQRVILNDIHRDLILMWRALVFEGWLPPDSCTEEEYEILKDSEPSALRGFVGHSCSFSGIWFDTFAKNGERNYCLNGKNSLIKARDIFNRYDVDLSFSNLSYEELYIPDGSVVYCDPPYVNTRMVGNKSYDFDYDKFWQWVRELSNKNKVFVSEYTAPEDFKSVLDINVHTDLNRAKRIEKLFVYNS